MRDRNDVNLQIIALREAENLSQIDVLKEKTHQGISAMMQSYCNYICSLSITCETISNRNAGDRGRTGTGITTHGILSPGRLPIPPLRHII